MGIYTTARAQTSFQVDDTFTFYGEVKDAETKTPLNRQGTGSEGEPVGRLYPVLHRYTVEIPGGYEQITSNDITKKSAVKRKP